MKTTLVTYPHLYPDKDQKLADRLNQYDEYNCLTSVTDVRGITLSYTYDEVGRLQTFDNRFGKTSYEYDLLDRVIRVIDHNGQATVYEHDVLGNQSYDAYGNLLEKEGGTENEFLYTGEQYNANTGLYYLRARYMNPSTGTFISMDSYQGSIYDPVSLHKYLYANANPVMYTDPSGYSSVVEAGVYMDCTSSLAVAEAYYNSVMYNIGMELLSQVWALKAVEAVSYLATTVLLSLAVEDAINEGKFTDAYDVAVEILQYALDHIEFICDGAGVASETVAEWIKTAIYEAKSKEKQGGKGKEKGRDNSEDTQNKEDSTDVSEEDKTADDIISEEKKGSIRQRFPREWLDKTKSEIEKAAKRGNKSAQTAKKLLNDKAFDKLSNSTRSKKGK